MMYKTKGVCAQAIEFEVDDNKKVHNVKFIGGCSGNTQGVAALVEGMDADEGYSPSGRHSVRSQTYFMSRSACKGFARSRNLSISFAPTIFQPRNHSGADFILSCFIYHFCPTYHKETAHLWKTSPNPYLDFPHFSE